MGGCGRRRRDRSPLPDLPCPGPQAYATVTVKPSSPARLLKVGAVVLISGAVLLLFGAIGAFYFWKGSDNHVSPEGGARGADPSLGARGGEARGAAASSLSPACPPLGGARALGRGGPPAAARGPSRPCPRFSPGPPGHLLPSSSNSTTLFSALGNFVEKQVGVLRGNIKT